ncbi:MAG: hypothetical protein ACJ77A_17190 [Actinomycetota bacterium]
MPTELHAGVERRHRGSPLGRGAPPTPFFLRYGREEPTPPRRALRAGPVSVELEDGDLRYASMGGEEIVRRIYVAVRDLSWNTIPGEINGLQTEDRGDAFRVTFVRTHRQGSIAFAWNGTIEGAPDGTLSYRMEGTALSSFPFAKIGICVHHAIRGTAGRPFHGTGPDGSVQGVFPELVGPQIHLEDGTDLPLFDPVDHLEIEMPTGIVTFDFEGDLFEAEDQRNWTDGSFKTYSTPARLGYRFDAVEGQRIVQQVTISTRGFPRYAARPRGATAPLRLHIGDPTGARMPQIGLGTGQGPTRLSERHWELLRKLGPAHLRADVHLVDDGWTGTMAYAREASLATGCPLELAVFADDGAADEQLASLADELAARPVRLSGLLLVPEVGETTPPGITGAARRVLGGAIPAVPFLGGTNAYFCELNRSRPDPSGLDGIAYSANPQIHATDERSLAEALEGLGETVRAARSIFPGLPIHVTPVTLRPRFNAVASEEAEAPDDTSQFDPRQWSLFGAAWTAGSVGALSAAGATGVTFFEMAGPLGVIRGADEPVGLPPASLGDATVSPIYHVLADAAGMAGGEVLACRSEDPLSVTAFASRADGHDAVVVANLTDARRELIVIGLRAEEATLRVLDEGSAWAATHEPDAFAADGDVRRPGKGGMRIQMQPCAVVRIVARTASDKRG